MDWLLLIIALFNTISVIVVFVPRTFPNAVWPFVVFLVSVIATELAWLWLALQAFLALLLAWAGALDSRLGEFAFYLLIFSWCGLVWNIGLGLRAGTEVTRSLRAGLGENHEQHIPNERLRTLRERIRFTDWCSPLGFARPDVEMIKDIPYLPGGIRRKFDIYRPRKIPAAGCPVLLQIHGGGWVTGAKHMQALPLMYFLASRGWICVAINYRLSPSIGFPEHLHDCKAALGWIRTNGAQYGMDPRFVAATGGSAGGHLAALMALTPNQPELQPDCPEADTSIQACVPLYSIYDLLSRHGQHAGHEIARAFMEEQVMHVSPEEHEALWNLGSPLMHMSEETPPFMIVHGSNDSLVPVTEARLFQENLRKISRNPVVFLELEGTEHSFDVFHSPRTEHTVNGIHRFLEWVRAT